MGSTKEVNAPQFMDVALKQKEISAEKGICVVSASGNSLTKCSPLASITLLTHRKSVKVSLKLAEKVICIFDVFLLVYRQYTNRGRV